jgi:hypothetical protein
MVRAARARARVVHFPAADRNQPHLFTPSARALAVSQQRNQLLSKFRTLSPPTQLASLRVSGTPSDAHTPAASAGVAFGLGNGSDTTAGAGAWWRAGVQHTSGGSSGVDSAERRLTSGAVRAVSFENGDVEPSPSTAGPGSDGTDVAAEAADAEEASHRLAMQLYEEEQHAFLSQYAERLISPENPVRRRASSIDPADLTPESMQMDGARWPAPRAAGCVRRRRRGSHARACRPLRRARPAPLCATRACPPRADMDESERLAWQLQNEELQYSAYRPRHEPSS